MTKDYNLEQSSIFKLLYNCDIPEIGEYIFRNETGLENIITKCLESDDICMLKILQKQFISISNKQRCKITREKMVAINDFKILKYLIRLGAPFYTEVANKHPDLVKEYKFITESELETKKLPSLEVVQMLIDKIWSKESIYIKATLEKREDILKFLTEQRYQPKMIFIKRHS
jgi:hypothetical protein